MSAYYPDRRSFLKSGAALIGAGVMPAPRVQAQDAEAYSAELPPYDGPNIVVIRFGGGVRRRETIDPQHTYSPYFLHELCKRGTLFPQMEIEQFTEDGDSGEKQEIETSHGQGTLYILTGTYERYKDIGAKFLGARFEPKVPTIFEYLRKAYQVPEHQTLIINGEDRTDEEFYSFSNHHLFGVQYRSTVLSLYRFKTFLLRRQLESGGVPDEEIEAKRKELEKLEAVDYRAGLREEPIPEIAQFWENWRHYYGESGFVNPRGDRLLTALATRAIQELRPKLMMINYNDPDYVHWGNPAHYTLGVSVIDRGIQRLVEVIEADEAYRDNTVFVIVPDCGRDSNRMMAVPYQHHFNTKSAQQIFALLIGPGIQQGVVVDKPVQQIQIASTVGRLMNAPTEYTEGSPLEEALS